MFYKFAVIFFSSILLAFGRSFPSGNSGPSMWDIFLNHCVNGFFLTSFLFSLESIWFGSRTSWTASSNFLTYSLIFNLFVFF